MAAHKALLLVFVASLPLVSGQNFLANYTWDCRRPHSSCKGTDSSCAPNNGTCKCGDSDMAFDCGLPRDDLVTCPSPPATTTTTTSTCQNNAYCKTGNSCYCTSNTYGNYCENERVHVECNEQGMFINIYPHGDASFSGQVFLNTWPTTLGRGKAACELKPIKDPKDSALQEGIAEYGVTDAQGNPPTLRGFYIALPHNATNSEDFCENALVQIDTATGRRDYIRKVVLEYNAMIISSVDQVLVFNCSVSSTSTTNLTSSINSMSVSLLDDDYQHVNATDTIEPITFEIRNPETNALITSSIHLGDPLDLVFFLSTPAGDTDSSTQYTSFYVVHCNATNGLPTDADEYKDVPFLKDGCPTAESSLLYRDSIDLIQEDKVVIPLNAFRFVGSSDQVAFTCQIKLCTEDDECQKPDCDGDSGEEGGAGNEGNGDDTSTEDNGNDNTENSGTDEPSDSNAGEGRRRKREAVNNTNEVSRTIHVTSLYDVGRSDASGSTYESKCMLHSDFINIVIIFSVIMCLLVIVVVVLVARLLRSRTKIVDASDTSTMMSQCSLPRLAVSTNYGMK